MYCLDTNTCIDWLKARSVHLLETARQTPRRLLLVPSMVRAELLFGAEMSKFRESERREVEIFLSSFRTLPFDDLAAEHHAQIRAHLERKGLRIGAKDEVIAATARANNVILVTGNTREFARIPGLKIEDWTKP